MDELSRAGLRVHTHTPWRGGQDSKTHTHAQERERERKTIEFAKRCFPAIHGPPPITRSETDRGCRRPLAEFDQSSRKHSAGLPLPLSPTFIHQDTQRVDDSGQTKKKGKKRRRRRKKACHIPEVPEWMDGWID